MAKRGASSELNHDNWDAEEAGEEAGEFKKASEAEMKGRVVRKAKRKLTEDGRKNVFAGFSGFSSTNTSSTDAFSFLKNKIDEKTNDKADKNEDSTAKTDEKQEGTKEDKNGENGVAKSGSAPTNGTSVFSGFSFSAGTSSDAPKEDSLKSTAAGDPTKLESKPVEESSSSTSSLGGFSFGASTKPAPPADGKGDLMSMFKPSTGTWICDVCMLSNSATALICIACESPKPGSKPTVDKKEDKVTTFSFGASGGFKFGEATSQPVSSASGFKLGEAVAPTSSASSGFKFGEASASTTPAVSGFKVGEAAAPAASAVSSFKFGESTTTTSTPAEDELKKEDPVKSFSFGAEGGFKFGGSTTSTSSTDEKASSSLVFGQKPEDAPSEDKEASKPDAPSEEKEASNPDAPSEDVGATKQTPVTFGGAGGFKFSNNSDSVGSGFLFASQNTTLASPAPTKGFSFGSETTATKGSIFENIPRSKSTSEVFKSPPKNASKSVSDFADTPRSDRKREYLSSLKALNVQVTNWIKSHVDENPLLDLTPVFKDYEKHIGELKKKCKDDGKTKELEEPSKETKPLSFGFQSTTTPVSNETSSKEEKNESKEDCDTEEVNPDPVEESDSLYTKKCKLYYKKGDSYVERGMGHIHLKRTDEKKLQLIVRAAHKLGNILLNIVMNEDIPLQKQGKNNLLLVCVPNPPIDPKAGVEPVPFLIKVKTEEDLDELKDTISDLMKN